MKPSDLRKEIQRLLKDDGYYTGKIDGDFGPLTYGAIQDLDVAMDPNENWTKVKATLFADPGDIKRFKECKAKGNTDKYCFQFGDNGIGKWGTNTTVNKPFCALPPDDWATFPTPYAGTIIEVKNAKTGKIVECELQDSMPAKKNIKNGAGIDLNPCAFDKVGLKDGEGIVYWRRIR